MQEYEDYTTIKILYFIGAMMISIAGIVLFFYVLGISVLFEATVPSSYLTKVSLIVLGSCFFVPMSCWIVYVFCPPCRKEQERRKVIETKRKIRARLEKKRYAYQWSKTDPDDIEAENRRLALSIKEKHERRVGINHDNDETFPAEKESGKLSISSRQGKKKKSINMAGQDGNPV